MEPKCLPQVEQRQSLLKANVCGDLLLNAYLISDRSLPESAGYMLDGPDSTVAI